MAYRIGIISDVGNRREKNEDSVLVRYRKTKKNEVLLAVAADGMGGLAYGERASRCVTESLNDWWQMQEELESRDLSGLCDELGFLTEKIHRRIRQEALQCDVAMGTTMSLLFLRDYDYFVLQAGDSRVYLLHRKWMEQLTEDQTWCQEQVRNGKLKAEELAQHPKRHVLSNALGAKDNFFLATVHGTVMKKEKFLLCTDGFYSYLEKNEQLNKRQEPQKILNREKQRILKERAEDNLSAIMIQI